LAYQFRNIDRFFALACFAAKLYLKENLSVRLQSLHYLADSTQLLALAALALVLGPILVALVIGGLLSRTRLAPPLIDLLIHSVGRGIWCS
jgi:hypothetical protein